MFVSICFRGRCIGWAWTHPWLGLESSLDVDLSLSNGWTCPSDTNNTWIYDAGDMLYDTRDGLHAACIQEEGEGTCDMMIKSPNKFDHIFQMNFLKTVATGGILQAVAATSPMPAAS